VASVSIKNENGLLVTWMLTLGSSKVVLRGAEVPGLCQSSATRPKRSVRPSLGNGDERLTYLVEAKGAVDPPVSILSTLWTRS
jgi:hypothetical protein